MNLSYQKAFTLIEILLVTSIISLLSTVVVSQSDESRKKADDAHMKQESHQIANAVNLYKNDNKGKVPVGNIQRNAEYPIVYENNTDGTAAAYQESMQILVDGGYLPEIPTSPNGQSYSYYVTEDEDNAMFAAELNFEPSNSSGSNSCEFVSSDSQFGSCQYYSSAASTENVSVEYYEQTYGGDAESLQVCSFTNTFVGYDGETPIESDYPCYKPGISSGFFSTMPGVFLFLSGSTCDTINYDTETEVCFGPINSSYLNSMCEPASYEENQCNPNALTNNFPDAICIDSYSETWLLNGYTECWYSSQSVSDRYAICQFEGGSSVCDGSDNSDYCSCI